MKKFLACSFVFMAGFICGIALLAKATEWEEEENAKIGR